MPTRQQRRARARAPARRKRRGQAAFLASIVAVLLAGGAAVGLFRAKPPPLTRGAIEGDHWHARYRIEICGRRVQPFPMVEGEIHTHGDGMIHIHPHSPAFTGPNANLGKFFQTVEGQVGVEDGRRFLRLPDGRVFRDGDTCTEGGKKEKLHFIVNGEEQKGDPAAYVLHEGDDIVLRFGSRAAPSAPTPPPARD